MLRLFFLTLAKARQLEGCWGEGAVLAPISPPPRISEDQWATEHAVSPPAFSPGASPLFPLLGEGSSLLLGVTGRWAFCTPDAVPGGRKCQALSFSPRPL